MADAANTYVWKDPASGFDYEINYIVGQAEGERDRYVWRLVGATEWKDWDYELAPEIPAEVEAHFHGPKIVQLSRIVYNNVIELDTEDGEQTIWLQFNGEPAFQLTVINYAAGESDWRAKTTVISLLKVKTMPILGGNGLESCVPLFAEGD